MKTAIIWLVTFLIIIISVFCYMHFSGYYLPIKKIGLIDPIEVFLSDPAAFREFLDDKNIAEAIHSSSETRKILTENANTAYVLLGDNRSGWFFDEYNCKINNQFKADKAISLLKNNPSEFTKFFRDSRVASKIADGGIWSSLELRLNGFDAEEEIERLKLKKERLLMWP